MELQSRCSLDGGEGAVPPLQGGHFFTRWTTGKKTAGLLVSLLNRCHEGNMSACIFVVAVVNKRDHIYEIPDFFINFSL